VRISQFAVWLFGCWPGASQMQRRRRDLLKFRRRDILEMGAAAESYREHRAAKFRRWLEETQPAAPPQENSK